MSSQVPIQPRTTRASARAREESKKRTRATSSYSQVYKKPSITPKPISMSVDRVPPFLDEPNITTPPCQTYETADDTTLPEKPRNNFIDRCYVLLTPLKKTSSSSGSTSQSLEPPAHRSTHSRASQKQRGEPVSGTSRKARTGHESDEAEACEALVPSKRESKRGRGPSRSTTRRSSNHQSDVDDSPTQSREVQTTPRPAGMITHLSNLVFDLAASALAIMGIYVIFVLVWQAYRSMDHSSCAVFCFVPA